MSRRGRRLAAGWRAVLGGTLAAAASACGPGAHYGLANAPAVTRDWHADDRARDAIANGPEACAPKRLERDRRSRDHGARPACADRGLLGIPARGGPPPR
jgi:hypothetical protein